jgi:hypothetical protein
MTTTETPAALYSIYDRRCECDKAPRFVLFEVHEQEESETDTGVRQYTCPEFFETHVGLEYLEHTLQSGPDASLRWAMIQAIGADGWNALRSPALDFDTFSEIVEQVLRRVRGSTRPGPKAKTI